MTAASLAAALKPTRVRLLILALLTLGTMINYLDRTVISIAAPTMKEELRLDPVVMGLVFSAFSWTYAAAQIPGGIFLDRVGARLTYFFSVTFWSMFTVLQGFTMGLTSLLIFRLGLGVAEAPCFPANSRILAIWFPQAERARANSVYSVGQYFGLGILSPALYSVTAAFGWRALFIGVGAIGIAFGLLWLKSYREPDTSKLVNKTELDLIEAGGGLGHTQKQPAFRWRHLGFLLRQRQIVGAAIGQFAGNAAMVFFLTWFPTYLATERHMAWLKAGFYVMLPFIAASVGVIVGGQLSDRLLRTTGNATLARKLPVIAGLLLICTIVGANFVDDNRLVIAILSVAFFGQGMVNLGWTLITDVAPKPLIGLTGGLFNLAANLAGIVTPLVIGLIVKQTGSFVYALAFIGVIALMGAFSYIFVLGPVRRVEFTEQA